MAKPMRDWYLRQWLDSLGVRFPHAWLQKEIGWSDGKTSNVLNGTKRYDRDIINDVAAAMKIEPYELLMHPAEAAALKQQRAAAATLASIYSAPAPAEKKTG